MKKAPRGSKRNLGMELHLYGVILTSNKGDRRLSANVHNDRQSALTFAKIARMSPWYKGARVVRLIAKLRTQ